MIVRARSAAMAHGIIRELKDETSERSLDLLQFRMKGHSSISIRASPISRKRRLGSFIKHRRNK